MNTLISPVSYSPDWLQNAADLFNCLQQTLPWQQEHIRMFGRSIAVPRLIAWIGDPDCVYRYSQVTHYPAAWIPELQQLRERLNQEFQTQFNAVLCNYYRDGKDYMGWHRDAETDLDKNSCIASISLGAKRRFSVRHCVTKLRYDYWLEAGSLLIMHEQKNWRHCLPKALTCNAPRINLTFRKIK